MAHPYIQNLIDARLHAWERAKEIMDAASTDKRELSAEEEASLATINTDLNAKDARIDEFVASEERAQKADVARARIEAVARPATVSRKTGEEERIRAFLSGETRSFESMPVMSERERRDVLKSSAGAPVPTSFYDRLMVHLVQIGPVRSNATILPTASGENIQLPRTATFAASAITAEGGAIAESDPTFGAFITLSAYKYSFVTQLSSELVTDSAVDLIGFLADQAAISLAVKTNTDYTIGDDAGKPNGIVVASTLGVTGAAAVAGVFTADNLIDLVYSVNPAYRMAPACQWQMRDPAIAAVRKLKDTTNQYLFQPGLNGETSDRLLGYALKSNPDVPAVAALAKSIIFGDVSRYYVREAGGVRFERSDEFAFNADLVTFRVILRSDGDLIDTTGAVKHFAGGAA